MVRFETKHYQQVTSTNAVLRELAREGSVGEGTVILADFQTAGRGRGKNVWNSEAGKNLLVSILLKPMIRASQHFLLNEFLSLAIIDTLTGYGVKASVKWPNDIYIQDRKLAGLLIENQILGDTLEQSIAGIGLNLNQENFPPDLPNPVSLHTVLKQRIDRDEFLDRLLGKLSERYQQLQQNEQDQMHHDYLQHSYRMGCEIEYMQEGIGKKGILLDILPQGEIVILTEDNRREPYIFGEIQISV